MCLSSESTSIGSQWHTSRLEQGFLSACWCTSRLVSVSPAAIKIPGWFGAHLAFSVILCTYTLVLPSPKFICHLFPLLVFTKPLDLIGHGKLFLRWPVPFHSFNQSQAGLKTQTKFKGWPKDTAQHMVLATEVMTYIWCCMPKASTGALTNISSPTQCISIYLCLQGVHTNIVV